jgi:hypothetical protein
MLLAATGFALFSAGCSSERALQTREAAPGTGFQARALLAVSDLDMAATGYADRKLRQLPGARDALTILSDLGGETPKRAAIFASNSVVGWPGPLALSPDNRFAYVIETQAEIDDAVAQVDDAYNAAPGRRLMAFDIADFAAPRLIGEIDVCGDPSAIDIHPSGAYAVIACRDAARPVVIVPFTDGVPQPAQAIALAIPDALKTARSPGVSFARLSPDGRTWAANIGNRNILFFDIAPGTDGLPTSARLIGAPVSFDTGWLSMGRWSLDGRHLIMADTAWGPGNLDAVRNGPGRILSIAFEPSSTHRLVSEARISLSPEGFDLNPTGTLLVVANMERTYLPDGLPYSLFGRRASSSLSLVAFDPAGGALTVVDGPVTLDAVLPEDVVFDDAGDTIAVVSYQDRSETPREAWAQLFEIDRSGAAPRLIPTATRWSLPRGAHDLAVIRGAE